MRSVIALAVASCCALLAIPSASAQDGDIFGGGDVGQVDPAPPRSAGSCDDAGRCFAGVEAGNQSGGAGSGTDPCTYEVGNFDFVLATLEAHLFGYVGVFGENPPENSEVYDRPWVLIYCPYSPYTDASILWGIEQLGDPPDATVVARVAEQAVVLPIPVPSFSPAVDDVHVVGLETWLWLDSTQTATVTRTACIPPVDYACVEVVGTFVDLSADMADGSEPLICDGSGVAYDFTLAYEHQRDEPHCGHVYTAAPVDGDTYPARVAGTWHVTYRCFYDSDGNGSREASCGGGSLGFIARVSEPQLLEVRDLQAVATRT